MKKSIITMTSMTYALKANSILSNFSVPSDVIRLNGSVSNSGCSYGVSVATPYLKNAIRILSDNNIPYLKVL